MKLLFFLSFLDKIKVEYVLVYIDADYLLASINIVETGDLVGDEVSLNPGANLFLQINDSEAALLSTNNEVRLITAAAVVEDGVDFSLLL